MAVSIARIYDDSAPSRGLRVLVDRVWPRGVSKESAHLDHWLREVGPSKELRTWFGHDPQRFAEFRRRYRAELATSEAFAQLRSLVAEHEDVTLLFGAKDTEHNQAVVLAELLTE